MSKINLRIISKLHAHLQSMAKATVKFQKNWNKIVGGIACTRYTVHTPIGGRKDRRTDGRQTDGMTESQKPCPSPSLRKGGGQKCIYVPAQSLDHLKISWLHVVAGWDP